ncbi:MAG: hypothetical protein NW237_03995 [Cyanobacteriota bacterium]|nr:hypothetical protein [Cyanobacteriota bacterium]
MPLPFRDPTGQVPQLNGTGSERFDDATPFSGSHLVFHRFSRQNLIILG